MLKVAKLLASNVKEEAKDVKKIVEYKRSTSRSGHYRRETDAPAKDATTATPASYKPAATTTAAAGYKPGATTTAAEGEWVFIPHTKSAKELCEEQHKGRSGSCHYREIKKQTEYPKKKNDDKKEDGKPEKEPCKFTDDCVAPKPSRPHIPGYKCITRATEALARSIESLAFAMSLKGVEVPSVCGLGSLGKKKSVCPIADLPKEFYHTVADVPLHPGAIVPGEDLPVVNPNPVTMDDGVIRPDPVQNVAVATEPTTTTTTTTTTAAAAATTTTKAQAATNAPQGPPLTLKNTACGHVLSFGGDAVYTRTAPCATNAAGDGCGDAWPFVPAGVSAGAGVNAALIGSVATANGNAQQATYNGKRLHRFNFETAVCSGNGQSDFAIVTA